MTFPNPTSIALDLIREKGGEEPEDAEQPQEDKNLSKTCNKKKAEKKKKKKLKTMKMSTQKISDEESKHESNNKYYIFIGDEQEEEKRDLVDSPRGTVVRYRKY